MVRRTDKTERLRNDLDPPKLSPTVDDHREIKRDSVETQA
jgi:hypothetical protein